MGRQNTGDARDRKEHTEVRSQLSLCFHVLGYLLKFIIY